MRSSIVNAIPPVTTRGDSLTSRASMTLAYECAYRRVTLIHACSRCSSQLRKSYLRVIIARHILARDRAILLRPPVSSLAGFPRWGWRGTRNSRRSGYFASWHYVALDSTNVIAAALIIIDYIAAATLFPLRHVVMPANDFSLFPDSELSRNLLRHKFQTELKLSRKESTDVINDAVSA